MEREREREREIAREGERKHYDMYIKIYVLSVGVVTQGNQCH